MKRRKLLFTASTLASASLLTALGSQSVMAKTPLKPITKPKPRSPGTLVTLAGKLKGYYAVPAGKGPFPAVIVQMEAFGLNSHIKDVCDRFAKAGYAALAPDFYDGATFAYTDVSNAIAKLKTIDDGQAMAAVGYSLDFLVGRPEVAPSKVTTIGFCMGGRLAFLTAIAHPTRLKASVCFYGGGIAANPDPLGRKALLDRIAAIQTPLLLLYGAEDGLIAADEHERIVLALSSQKKRYTLSVFPKAGHGFFCNERDSYVPAVAAEAWETTLTFLKRATAS
jgi:carboxymethylenebutenolidase